MKKICLLLLILLTASSGYAQKKWTLRECIDYAVKHNIELKQMELEVKNNEVELNTSKYRRLPNLNADMNENIGFGRSISSETNTYESKSSFQSSFGINTRMPVFTGFKIPNQIQKSELDLKAASEGLKKIEENLNLNVTTHFLEVLFEKEVLKAYKEYVTMNEKQVERTKILVEAGKVPASQIYDIKAQLAKDELNVTVAENKLKTALLNLTQLLNLQNDEFDITSPDMDQIIAESVFSLRRPKDIYHQAIEIKPHIKEKEYQVLSSKKTLNIARADYYPTVTLGAGYSTSYQRLFGESAPSLTNQIKNRGSESISLSVSIPIFNRFEVRNSVRSARLNIESKELELANTKLSLYKEIEQAYQSALSAQAKYKSTEKAREAAEESYKYAQERYEVGKSTVFELNESQVKLFTSRSEQIQAKYDFLFRTKILDFYQGKDIDIE